MNESTDLLPVGEAYADLDLVVRQLDDGSLTVSSDDSLPDEQRVQIKATGDGLLISLVASAAPIQSEGLIKALAHLTEQGPSEFSWRDGHVHCQGILPWPASGTAEFPPSSLKRLYGDVVSGARDQGPKLEQVADGSADWSIVSDSPAAAPSPEPAAEAAPAVPPSFLPGAGQASDEDRATMRYGGADEVPGKSELSPADRGRPAPGAPVGGPVRAGKPAGGGSPLPALIGGACVLLAVGIGGLVAMSSDPPPPPPPPKQPEQPTPPDDKGDEGDEDDEGEVDLDDGAEDPVDLGEPDPDPIPEEPKPTGRSLDTVEGMWAGLADSDPQYRKRALEAWLADHLYQEKGARKRLLETIDGRFDRYVNPLLTKHFEENPVEPLEALECLELANLPLRRILIRQIGEAQVSPSDAEIVAEMLGEQKETSDMLVEVALIKLGHPKQGAGVRLIQGRGPEWASGGEGLEVMKRLISHDLSHLEPMIAHSDERLRILAAELLAEATDSKKALPALAKLLGDRSLEVRRRAVEALQERSEARSSWALAKRLLVEKDERTKTMIRDAISRLPSEETAKLLRHLYARGVKSKNAPAKAAAVEAMQAQAHPAGVKGIVRVLRDTDPKIQLQALTALGRLHKQPALSDAVSGGLSEVRRVALTSKDKAVHKAARRLHYTISGRFPK